MIERVLIATDGSDAAGRAEEYALSLAELAGAEIHALYVVETKAKYILTIDLEGEEIERYEEYGEETVTDVVEKAQSRGLTARGVVRKGKIAPEIVDYATENGIDQIVMGRKGHGTIGKYVGSTPEKVIRMADIPITVVESGDD